MSANTNLSDVDFPDVFSNDELAANLQKCAILVKKGEKDPLIRQTIHDLTYYLTGKRVGGANYNPNASSNSNHLQSSPTQSTLSKHSHKSLTGVLGKMVGLTHDNPTPIRSEAHKSATSSKNAERAKADLAGLGGVAASSSQEWCAIHSAMGCQCKNRKTFDNAKPPFQRPTSSTTALIANGWIEQQRRSRMRTVWKEVLASLVEGRKPGEETTLWIQREVVNPTNGKTELEALHQIPVKWLQQVTYHNYTTDHRFSLKVYNLQEEFVFRCEQSQEAAQDWVVTLQSMQEIARKGRLTKLAKTGLDDWDKQSSSFEDEKKAPDHAVQSHRVAHATPQAAQGISQEQQAAAQQHAAQQAAAATAQHVSAQQAAAQQAAAQQTAAQQAAAAAQQASAQKGSAQQATSENGSAQQAASQNGYAQQHATTTHRMTVNELRAIAHGAGVVTHGMERGELERVVQQIAGIASAGAGRGPPPSAASPPEMSSTNPASPTPSQKENVSQSTSAEADALRKNAEERQQLGEEAVRRKKLAEESARSRTALEAKAKADEEKRRAMAEQSKQQQEAEKRRKEEEDRQRLEAERKLREDEEHRRRVAELQAAEQRRRLEEQQRQQQAQWQQQQQQWQKQQVEEEQRRRVEEQRVAEERRRQEEAYRMQHQQWQQQQQRAQAAGVPPQQWQGQPVPPNHYGQQPQPFTPGQVPPHPGAGPPPPPPGSSPVNLKYAKMAAQTDDGGQRTLQIKHSLLVEWALQPPAMQILRPIERLITSIHAVFPPKFGVAGHDHFTKWTVVTMPEVLTGAQPDDEKLKKIMRKLRFFLHPDKLPRDFSEEQTFMCKMLWDITSDAFEDHKKKEEELGWMR